MAAVQNLYTPVYLSLDSFCSANHVARLPGSRKAAERQMKSGLITGNPGSLCVPHG